MLIYLLVMLGLSALALRIRPSQTPYPEPSYKRLNDQERKFLMVYVWARLIQIGRLVRSLPAHAQLPLLLIRQAKFTMQFGRGLLHS